MTLSSVPRFLKSVASYTWSTMDQWIFQRWRSIANVMGAGREPSYTGKNINANSANNSSVWWACSRVISDPVGFLPLHLYRRVGVDERVRDRENALYRLLHDAPNPYTPACTFRQTLQAHALAWGNGYARIVRRSGTGEPISMWIIPPDKIAPIVTDAAGAEMYDSPVQPGNTFHYRLQTKNGPQNLDWRDVFHLPGLGFDGVCGYSVIGFAANSVALDLSALEYGGKFFARGGRVPYILKIPNKFKTDQEFDAFREKWDEVYADPHRAPILTGGNEYQQIGFKPEDSQLLATRTFSVAEICRWFLVNPYKVGDLKHATMNNVEQLGLEFVHHTLGYWLALWTSVIWLRLFSPAMQETHFAEFDYDELVQGDFKTRMEGWGVAKNNGFVNADWICGRENLPKLPNGAGAAYHQQGAMATVPGTGEPTAFERATLARAEAGKKPKPPTGETV